MTAKPAALELTVEYHQDDDSEPPPKRRISTVLRAALDAPAQLTVRFVSSAESHVLNLRHLGKDRPANVLVFAYPETVPQSGDIAICPAIVEAEARELNIACAHRYTHLLVHAALHLQGMRHDTRPAAQAMENTERRVLASLGLSDPYLV